MLGSEQTSNPVLENYVYKGAGIQLGQTLEQFMS